MKQLTIILTLLLLITIGCNQQKQPFNNSIKKEYTSIKGKVNKWHTDTVYMATLPFHSPYSTYDDFKVISADKAFEFKFDNIDKPFILLLTPERKFLDYRKFLLFESLTDKYYKGYCKDFYTKPMSTYIIEPGSETIVELTKISRYGETQMKILNENAYNLEYYQTTFDLDQRFDEVVTLAKTRDKAIEDLNNKRNELLIKLDKEKKYISPFLYKYVKAEIEFGARKEFLRYLMLDHKEETSQLFGNEIPTEINNVIKFNKENVDYATLISQEYNEFLELYLNFKFSELKNELITYKEFDNEKFDFALKELPQASKYYYLANNLLYSVCTEQTKELFASLIVEYPQGELNDRLSKKYN
ncbi:MAG: hypothetical protein ABFS12_09735 [Bacteroidota bacterium]